MAADKEDLRDNHIPYILQEEDELRTEVTVFAVRNITQFPVIMAEPNTYHDPCVGSEWSLADFSQ